MFERYVEGKWRGGEGLQRTALIGLCIRERTEEWRQIIVGPKTKATPTRALLWPGRRWRRQSHHHRGVLTRRCALKWMIATAKDIASRYKIEDVRA